MLICYKVHTEEDYNRMTDDTVEGACILMNKIGYIIDDRRKKEEAKVKQTANLERMREYD